MTSSVGKMPIWEISHSSYSKREDITEMDDNLGTEK